MKAHASITQGRIYSPIGDVLLQKILKESPGGIQRRLFISGKREVDRNWLAAAREQLIVCVTHQFAGADAGSGHYYQAVASAGSLPYELLQFRVAATNSSRLTLASMR